MSSRPLGGVSVVDASVGMAGGLAAMLLADFGADVVRVTPTDPPDPAERVWARGKRFVDATGSELAGLIAAADVHVSSALDAVAGEPPHDRLVQLLTPPYLGSHTPWAGGAESDPLLAAIAGVSLRQASVDDVPVESIYRHLLTVQGVWAAACAVAALVEREASGLGQRVTVGGLHGAMIAAAAAFTFDEAAPDPAAGTPRPGGSGGAVPFYRTYQCGDGEWLFLAALTPRFTTIAFAVLGVPDLLEHPRLAGGGRAAVLLPDHAGWAIETLAEIFRRRPRDEWLAALAAAGCPAGPLLERGDWLDHPQLAAIGMRLEVDGAVMPGNPIHLDAPSGHQFGVVGRIRPTTPKWTGGGPGPLAGVRVLDLGAIIAGPFGASLLAELGADVIKVEPLTGDSFRGPGFAAYNKGQRGIALDLQHPEGRSAFLDLVRRADVVVDNYRPGVLGRLRLRHEDLVEVNPAITTLSVTGFGAGGPLGAEPGFDPVLQAMSGMMKAQGGDGDPVFFTVPVNDVTTAASSALACCVALFGRTRTGVGAAAWTSLAGTSALLQAGELVRYDGRPPAPRGGTDFPGPADDDRYHRVADGWVRVQGSPGDATWATATRDEVVRSLTERGIPAAAALRARELVADESTTAGEVLHRDPRPKRASWWTAGRHARFSRTERPDTLAAPALGEHTREVLREAGFSDERIESLIERGIAGAGRT